MTETSPRVRARSRRGRCYELAFKGLLAAPEWTLVHGTVSNRSDAVDQSNAERIGHAWLECGGQVYDAVGDKFYSVAAYYQEWHAIATNRYTIKEAASCSLASKFYGPWNE